MPPVLAPFKGILSFEEVKQTVDSGNWERFSRTPEVSAVYANYLEKLPTIYTSVSDAVKIDTLGFESRVDEGSGLLRAVDPVGSQFVRLVRNPFPYATLPGIEHWVLWNMEQYNEFVEKEFGRSEHLWFVNPPHRKTVPGIHHCHIFVNTNVPISRKNNK
ncbi:hypothetical protein HK100_002794 [Physocladia obscura]|uniref:Uncharacterized protein n=1 Tax=Physocladia obscura TaxID=109957 RepID=A0AAD5SV59_9FUNG|nr:hypothetical protein HK100_002794 [Physocladia obscura]